MLKQQNKYFIPENQNNFRTFSLKGIDFQNALLLGQ
jgi:hypothetical protein